jgi:hypothetical protein
MTDASEESPDRMPTAPTGRAPRPHTKAWYRAAAKLSRWLHIYLSMVSLAAIFFFSITGLTLNHPDWFFGEHTVHREGRIERAWLHRQQSQHAQREPHDATAGEGKSDIDELAIVEHLRHTHRLSGRVSEFLTFEDECEVTFQGPGYAATARIQRADGTYGLDVTSNDLVSVLNDLHKGRHTGPLWSWVIDLSAIVSAIVALSGWILIFTLKMKRTLRITLSIVGLALLIALARIAMH